MLVWVDGWQMDCCGDPFHIGDTVEWTLSEQTDRGWLASIVGDVLANRIDRAEDHHGGLADGAPVTTAHVAGIRTVTCRYEPAPDDPKLMLPVPDSAELVDVSRAERFFRAADGLTFVGYLADAHATGQDATSSAQ